MSIYFELGGKGFFCWGGRCKCDFNWYSRVWYFLFNFKEYWKRFFCEFNLKYFLVFLEVFSVV